MFEEVQLGDERYNIFTDCKTAKSSTIVLRGGSEQFLEESHRSVHDALMIVKRTMKNGEIVAGGGAVELEIARVLRKEAVSIPGKQQLIIQAVADSMEVIPRQLSENAGLDAVNMLSLLNSAHDQPSGKGRHTGVDLDREGICDTYAKGVWEPVINKHNSIASAIEAACMILSIDETVRHPASEKPGAPSQGVGLGRGGAPISAGMGGAGMAGMMGGGQRGMPRGVRKFKGRGGG